MKKNAAGQKIGAQMITAADGTAFTGAVTVEVTLDAGTQATGSVGSGACTHEGNGYHTYAPAQAETNGDLVAFTFHGTAAIPATVQVFTAFPQTGDNFARLGAPAGASVSADIAALPTAANVKTQVVAALNTDTYAESSAVPAATATLVAKIAWLATLARNKITQTATTQLVRNDGDSGTVGTSTVSDDATTFTRGKFA